jgi:hypothetical protein
MTETIAYEITGKAGDLEFRMYPDLVLATVDNPADDAGFNLLFAYITGNNSVRDKIPMTAPVFTSQQIPMTSPVVSDGKTMAFVMPPGKSREDIPEPLDSRIQVMAVPRREIAVIRFAGYARKDEVEAAEAKLLEGLKNAGIASVGQPFLMRYNTPWTPGFLRRNEVGIEIRR